MHAPTFTVNSVVAEVTAEYTSALFSSTAVRRPRDRARRYTGYTSQNELERNTQQNARPYTSRPWIARGSHRARIDNAVQHAWRLSTSSRYDSGVSQFLRFASENHIPLHDCLPASEDLLCAFAASFSGSLAGKTISNKCSGIRKWHIQNNVPYFGGRNLKYVIKGSENLRPAVSRIAQRPAVSADMLDLMARVLDPKDPFDVCVLFVALTSFWAQIRLGEFLAPRETRYDADLIPRWSDLKSPSNTGSRVLHLPRTKMGGTKGEDVIVTRQLQHDPIACLERHHTLNFSNEHDSLASYLSHNGVRVALTKRKFLMRCNTILQDGGLPIISGHCFRIGGTTFLLLAGVPPDIVKLLGRWSSDSFLRYWRSLELIAPLYAELLEPVLRDAGLLRPSA